MPRHGERSPRPSATLIHAIHGTPKLQVSFGSTPETATTAARSCSAMRCMLTTCADPSTVTLVSAQVVLNHAARQSVGYLRAACLPMFDQVGAIKWHAPAGCP